MTGVVVPKTTSSCWLTMVTLLLLFALGAVGSDSQKVLCGASDYSSYKPGDYLVKEILNDSKAVCNNGSSGLFYRRSCTSTCNPNKWVIYFEAGDLCTTNDECGNRTQNQNRSFQTGSGTEFYKERLRGRTVLDSRKEFNPELSSWTHVYIPYCSSDLYLGRAGRLNENFTYNGYYIVQAVIKRLMDAHGLRNASGTSILFAGELLCLSFVYTLPPAHPPPPPPENYQ